MLSTGMKYLTLVAAAVVLSAGLAVAQPLDMQATASANGERSLTGIVTCSGRVTHQFTCQKDQPSYGCTMDCVNRGYDFVLLVGGKPYALNVSRNFMEAFAGGKATVTGVVAGDRVEVGRVSAPNGTVRTQDTWAGK
jgi:hypothetical protein